MVIRDLFSKDINRSINGVIKVSQSDEESIQQELSEYVVTRELQRHFAYFFENYETALDIPTDKIGVWISGFFGSGKSHFLKMLSYLLANKVVCGRAAIDYFDGKLEDEMVYSKMRRCAGVPTEAILFNIDTKGGQWKEGDTAKTALLRAFGDTKRPMLFLTISGVVNACLNLFFVIVCGMSVDGVATATVISQYISLFLVVRCLCRSEGLSHLELKSIRLDEALPEKCARLEQVLGE